MFPRVCGVRGVEVVFPGDEFDALYYDGDFVDGGTYLV